MVRSTRLKEPRRRKPAANLKKLAAVPARTGDRRLTKTDWIEAGQDLVRDFGITNLRLAALTRRLGVSTGSFYHHFQDFEEYLAAVAEYYSVDRVRNLLRRAAAETGTPIDRLKSIGRLSLKEKAFELDAAMRVWATMDERADRAVVRAEEITLDFLAGAFRDLGISSADAAFRARVLLSVNIARLITMKGKSRGAYLERTLEFLIAPDNKASAKNSLKLAR
jgi:AcrR family transcriptional regulator